MKATAEYTGEDKDCYKNTSIEISITRKEAEQSGGNDQPGAGEQKAAAVGEVIDDANGDGQYKVTSDDPKNPTVSYEGSKDQTAKKIIIPKTIRYNGVTYTVTSVSNGALANHKSATEITVGDNVETIGDNAFAGCKYVTRIVIPKKTRKIGKFAFKGNPKLKWIIVKTKKLTQKTVAKKAFKGVGKKVKIKVPKAKKKAYKQLFRKKGLSKKVRIK